jgi:glycosyltransferase involved in cell wall biosynthesis
VLAAHPEASLRGVARRAPSAVPLDLAVLLAGTLARGGSPAEAARWLRRRDLLRALLGDAARVLFPSPATRDRIAPLLAHDRWEEIPYGLDSAWFEAPRASKPPALDPAALTIGFAGSLQRHKGPDLLLDAAHRLGWTKTRLRIAGTPDDAAFVAALRERARGLHVEFAGPLSPAEMRTFLRELDLFVVASRWPENSPFVLLEAQAAAVPVIASDVAGISHRIPDSRMLFEAGSPEDLARALHEFLACPSSLPAPPVSSLETMTRATEAAYRKALDSRAPTPNE